MTETSLLSHLTNAALVVYTLQWLKGTQTYQKFATALPIANHRVHVIMSAIGAAATALGMHGAIVGTSDAGWQLTLAIPPLWIILHGVWDWAQQFALNRVLYGITLQQKAIAPAIVQKIDAGTAAITSVTEVHP